MRKNAKNQATEFVVKPDDPFYAWAAYQTGAMTEDQARTYAHNQRTKQMGTLTVTYTVDSLEGIATLFDKRAANERQMAEYAIRQRDKDRHMAEASAWDDAARIVRSTTIKPKEAA